MKASCLGLPLVLVCTSVLTASCAPGPTPGLPDPAVPAQGQVSIALPTAEVSLPPSPPPAPTREPQAICRPFMEAELRLAINNRSQVMVIWQVDGGCPPYEGTLTAWYQDELQPSMVLPLRDSSGRMLDTPILHRGAWDRDYYLTITDAGGHRVHLAETITIGG